MRLANDSVLIVWLTCFHCCQEQAVRQKGNILEFQVSCNKQSYNCAFGSACIIQHEHLIAPSKKTVLLNRYYSWGLS